MLILHEQEKAFNAIKFFHKHTMGCDKLKLFKLLFFLDFEHYEKTGRTVTGFNYKAWNHGPVPIELWQDIKYNTQVLENDFSIEPGSTGYDSMCLVPKTEYNPSVFSKRERAILADVAERFEMMNATEIEEFTHRAGTPWQRVFEVDKRPDTIIPLEYQLSGVDEETRETILELAEDRNSILAHFQ